jgi:hypothetical protein
MPLVFAMNDSSESSIEYADIAFEAYEYPAQYRKKIQPGRPFVYYRGRRRVGGGRQPQVYLGTGIVGDIRESATPGRLICQVLDGEKFLVPLPFKNEDSSYLEPGGSRSGYFQQGVREIPEAAFQRIVALGGGGPMDGSAFGLDPEHVSSGLVRPGYADAADARETERQSRRAVTEILAESVPGIEIAEMATNNPGFDLETSAERFRFVEVKGTIKRLPTFFLSEGERRFGAENAGSYLLGVVYGMDLSRETYEDIAWSRAPLKPGELLNPSQWAGRLPISGTPGRASLDLI